MSLVEYTFYLFAGFTVFSAILIARSRNIIYSAFVLFITLFSIAALFVFCGADYLAVSQIIVYVGGVLVLILFGVMLTNRLTFQGNPQTEIINWMPAFIVCILLFGLIVSTISASDWQISTIITPTETTTTRTIGLRLFSDFLLPLEAISVLLTIALLGAAYLSRRKAPQPREVSSNHK
ncbi:MAG: NADH-quinone oxidoreductase subunit J [Bacteroidia bacterium]|nr:NADH-quinone oxidoreductase subunit J [Bacteroidia bacterium]